MFPCMQEDVAVCQIYTFCVALEVNNDTHSIILPVNV